MALSQSELTQIKSIIGQDPTAVETAVFDTMWSEHCSYKSSRRILKQYLPTSGKDVALGIGEDSGVVHFTTHKGRKYGIAVSHESHNHPSQVLPIEGAATGVGGVVRDVYCMGADVVGVLNSLHFGVSEDAGAMVNQIADRVVEGVGDYANPLGVPVLGGETLYDPSYNDNCLVNVAAVGLLDLDDLIHSYVPDAAKNEPFDVILIGKSTDSTGFGGASFASAVLDQSETGNKGAVQVHDPFIKRILVESLKALFAKIKQDKIPVGLKDLGAGGIACATSEIAAANGFGVEVQLDKVNVALPDLAPEVIACAETQERFCLVAPQRFTAEILAIFNDEFELPKQYPNAGAVVIGSVTQSDQFVMTYNGKSVCKIPVSAITTDVQVTRESAQPSSVAATPAESLSNDRIESLARDILKANMTCSKRYVYRHFDQAVRGHTIVYPGEADAVVVAPIEGSYAGLVTSMDSNLYGHLDPYWSGAAAVAESVRNVVAVGGIPLAITDCLNYGNPEDPDVFSGFEDGVRGIADAAKTLGFQSDSVLPIVSGNVSFYNESKTGQSIVPSPVICVVARLDDYRKAVTLALKEVGSHLIRIGKGDHKFGGSTAADIEPKLGREVLTFSLADEHQQNKALAGLIADQKILSAHDISTGGMWVSLCEMTVGERGLGQIGWEIQVSNPEADLFSESGGYVIEVSDAKWSEVTQDLTEKNIRFEVLGRTTSEPKVQVSNSSQPIIALTIQALSSDWNHRNLAS